jgi:hypothetical protein
MNTLLLSFRPSPDMMSGREPESRKKWIPAFAGMTTQDLITRKWDFEMGSCKIPPNLPFPKGGNNTPLWQRGVRGDFSRMSILNDEIHIAGSKNV